MHDAGQTAIDDHAIIERARKISNAPLVQPRLVPLLNLTHAGWPIHNGRVRKFHCSVLLKRLLPLHNSALALRAGQPVCGTGSTFKELERNYGKNFQTPMIKSMLSRSRSSALQAHA